MPLCLLHIAPKVPAWIYCTADEWSSSISALVFVGFASFLNRPVRQKTCSMNLLHGGRVVVIDIGIGLRRVGTYQFFYALHAHGNPCYCPYGTIWDATQKKRPIFSAIALFELETTEKKKKKEEGSMAACFTPDNDLRIQLGSTTKSNLRGNLFFGRVSPRLSIHFFCFRCFLFCLFAY